MAGRLILLALVAVLTTGCAGIKIGVPDTPGAFISAVEGKTFEPMDTLDPRNAMIYVYRPATQWGYEEVQAPTFFVDGQQLFGLKSGAYSWIEVHGGRYDFYARRPLGMLFLKTIFELPLEIEGGRNYYFRYSETRPVIIEEIADNPEQYVQGESIQQVPEAFALREMKHLRLDQAGMYYGGDSYRQPRWAPFWTYSDKPEQSASK